jgi:hypothetical protein
MADGLGSLGREFLAEISGSVVHCVKYGTGKSGKIRCSRFKGGRGAPNARARKKAGVKRRFYKGTMKHVAVRKGRGKKVCERFGRTKSGRRVCRSWAPTRGPLKSGRLTGKRKKVCYMRKLKSGKRKRICRTVGKRSGSIKGKRKKARTGKKRSGSIKGKRKSSSGKRKPSRKGGLKRGLMSKKRKAARRARALPRYMAMAQRRKLKAAGMDGYYRR